LDSTAPSPVCDGTAAPERHRLAANPRSSFGASASIPLALTALTFAAGAMVFTIDGEELSPVHHMDGDIAVALGITLGLACFARTVWSGPRTLRVMTAGFLGSCAVALLACPVTGITLERAHDTIDFMGGPIEEHERDLPIGAALIHHHRGVDYQVWLRDYTVLLEVDESDYLASFGKAEHVRPSGYCVHVTVQSFGKASRIFAPNLTLPRGSLVRCPRPGLDRTRQQDGRRQTPATAWRTDPWLDRIGPPAGTDGTRVARQAAPSPDGNLYLNGNEDQGTIAGGSAYPQWYPPSRAHLLPAPRFHEGSNVKPPAPSPLPPA
jgi:hypothetical protein